MTIHDMKERLFLIEECHPLMASNIEKMTELENHHLATINTIIESGKNHQLMLKLGDESLRRNKAFM